MKLVAHKEGRFKLEEGVSPPDQKIYGAAFERSLRGDFLGEFEL